MTGAGMISAAGATFALVIRLALHSPGAPSSPSVRYSSLPSCGDHGSSPVSRRNEAKGVLLTLLRNVFTIPPH